MGVENLSENNFIGGSSCWNSCSILVSILVPWKEKNVHPFGSDIPCHQFMFPRGCVVMNEKKENMKKFEQLTIFCLQRYRPDINCNSWMHNNLSRVTQSHYGLMANLPLPSMQLLFNRGVALSLKKFLQSKGHNCTIDFLLGWLA